MMSMASSQARPRSDGVPQRLQPRPKPSAPSLVTRESGDGAPPVSLGASEAHLSPNTMAYAKDRPGRRSGDCFNHDWVEARDASCSGSLIAVLDLCASQQ